MMTGGQRAGKTDSDGTRQDGLAQRMRHIAMTHGLDLGEVRAVDGSSDDAEAVSDRGPILVSLRTDGMIHVLFQRHRTFPLTSGWTDELVAVVEAAALWRRGCTLRALHERFPFMSWSELEQAFEDGNPVPVKWTQLLASSWHLSDRPFIQAAHDHPELRLFYPDISHGSLILSRKPFEMDAGLAKVTPLSEGDYLVTMFPGGFRREVKTLDAALEVAAACFRSLG
ncbi:DUF6193 family natural product biosynthesis protein [Streptomyces sp. cg35]|uniref:DUF6193 family natural product biosynthesis protein n=1 Tax=Streptomyces sp. cg35 TaxID=3421650 RepID=UPI003D1753E2